MLCHVLLRMNVIDAVLQRWNKWSPPLQFFSNLLCVLGQVTPTFSFFSFCASHKKTLWSLRKVIPHSSNTWAQKYLSSSLYTEASSQINVRNTDRLALYQNALPWYKETGALRVSEVIKHLLHFIGLATYLRTRINSTSDF